MTDTIPFTQFLLPHGRRQNVEIPAHHEVVENAKDIINSGYRFECEVLSTGQISLTIFGFDPDEDEYLDLDIELCNNGPEFAVAVAKLVSRFHSERIAQ